MFQIPYHTGYTYTGEIEVQNIFEETLTLVFNSVHFAIFYPISLCEIEYDSKTNTFFFEVYSKDNAISFDEDKNMRYIKRLNHLYAHLKEKCIEKKLEMELIFNNAIQQYNFQLQSYGFSQLNLDKYNVDYINYCKKWQYFLFANITFLSCAKANYDRLGKTCVIYFKCEY